MFNDRKIVISVGASKKSINWQRQELNWSDFVKKFEKPSRSLETLDEYLKMSRAEQDALKDTGGFVGGALSGGRRKSNSVLSRDLVTLDFDNIPGGFTDEVVKRVMTLGCSYLIYSTRKHASYKPRLRIVLPSDRSMNVDEYEPVARKLAEYIGIEMADPTTFQASRLMYWPSCSRDSEYVYKFEDKPFFSVDGILEQYSNWKDVDSWPRIPGESTKHRSDIAKQVDPTAKPGIVGAFCRAYNIYEALETFIPTAYDACDNDRLSYLGGSTTGGAVIYQDSKFLYSHHATDPTSGQLVNSWDLVRLHKFGDLDNDADPQTPPTSLPSWKAMRDLARSDKRVASLLDRERLEEARGYFDAVGQNETEIGVGVGVDTDSDGEQLEDWRNLLTRDGKGNIEKTQANIVTILKFDENYKGKIFFNEFSNRGMVECPLPWDASKEIRPWTDFDDAQLALRLEKEYGIVSDAKMDKALKVVSYDNRRNEVKELFQSIRWDGVERINTLLSEYLGAEQNVYTADIMRKALTAAVARACNSGEGVKFDTMIVFSGKQGIGKSTFLAKLGMNWFNDSIYSFDGKEASELIQGTLIVELGELTAMNRSEEERVKQFLSKTHDTYREAYGRHVKTYPRRCVFFGSTNSDAFLRDTTGNRRFWPVNVGEFPQTKSVFTDLTKNEVLQIWAEAYVYYMLGESLILSGESAEYAEKMQKAFREEDPRRGEVIKFLEKPIPDNWYSLDIMSQRKVLAGEYQTSAPMMERDRVCVQEIWALVFYRNIGDLRRRDSNEIHSILSMIEGWVKDKSSQRFGLYGTQRGYMRNKIVLLKNAQKV